MLLGCTTQASKKTLNTESEEYKLYKQFMKSVMEVKAKEAAALHFGAGK